MIMSYDLVQVPNVKHDNYGQLHYAKLMQDMTTTLCDFVYMLDGGDLG